MKIAIVTDSSSDIPPELAKKYDIEVLPMYIGYGGVLKKDGVDIFPEEVYSALRENKKVHTSSPSIGDFLKIFHFLLDEKGIDLVCCITLSSRLSGAFNAACVAGKKFKDGLIKDTQIKDALLKNDPAKGDLVEGASVDSDLVNDVLIKCAPVEDSPAKDDQIMDGPVEGKLIKAEPLKNDRVRVFDSKTSTICLGFIVLAAAQAASQGRSFEEIEAIINVLIVKNRFFALLENFEYVFIGGRGTFFGKFISKALRFTPILTIGKAGKVHLAKFAKNKNSALEEIYKMAVRTSMSNSSSKFGVFYGEDVETAKYLEKMLKSNKDIRIDEIIITKITTVISAHTGPGIFGIAVSPGSRI